MTRPSPVPPPHPEPVAEFDSFPPFTSRRSLPPAPPEPEENKFGLTLVEWVVGFGLGAILVGFGILIGMVL